MTSLVYYFAFELKYVKKEDAATLSRKIEEGHRQLTQYLAHEELQEMANLKAWLIIFSGAELVHLEELNTRKSTGQSAHHS